MLLSDASACRWEQLLDRCIEMQRCHTGLLGIWEVLQKNEWRMKTSWSLTDKDNLQAALGKAFHEAVA